MIKTAQEFGMIIDLAHLNAKSFFDAAKISTKPLFVSHAGVKAVCEHPRNLSDEQLLKIKETNGVIGIPALSFFLNHDPNQATIDDLVAHIMHVVNFIGSDYVGFGFDFCYYLDNQQANDLKGLAHISDVAQLIPRLKACGLNEQEINKICYDNMYRVVMSHLK